jgi:hypothetical protein
MGDIHSMTKKVKYLSKNRNAVEGAMPEEWIMS